MKAEANRRPTEPEDTLSTPAPTHRTERSKKPTKGQRAAAYQHVTNTALPNFWTVAVIIIVAHHRRP